MSNYYFLRGEEFEEAEHYEQMINYYNMAIKHNEINTIEAHFRLGYYYKEIEKNYILMEQHYKLAIKLSLYSPKLKVESNTGSISDTTCTPPIKKFFRTDMDFSVYSPAPAPVPVPVPVLSPAPAPVPVPDSSFVSPSFTSHVFPFPSSSTNFSSLSSNSSSSNIASFTGSQSGFSSGYSSYFSGSSAMYSLANYYLSTERYKEAIHFFLLASRSNHSTAYNNLALILDQFRGNKGHSSEILDNSLFLYFDKEAPPSQLSTLNFSITSFSNYIKSELVYKNKLSYNDYLKKIDYFYKIFILSSIRSNNSLGMLNYAHAFMRVNMYEESIKFLLMSVEENHPKGLEILLKYLKDNCIYTTAELNNVKSLSEENFKKIKEVLVNNVSLYFNIYL